MTLYILYKDDCNQTKDYYQSMPEGMILDGYIQGISLGMYLSDCTLTSIQNADTKEFLFK